MIDSTSVRKLTSVAAWTSFACGLHCLLSSLVLGMLPFLGGKEWLSESIENLLIVLSLTLGSASTLVSFRAHRRKTVLVLLALSVAMVVLGRLAGEGVAEVALISGGAAVLAGAQLLNLRWHRSACIGCQPE